MSFARKGEANDTKSATTTWQGWLDSNQRVRESKSLALPLGYTPVWRSYGKQKAGGDAPAFRLEWGG